MSQENSFGDTSKPDEPPNDPTDANFLPIPSQVELLQPLQDSQDSNCSAPARDPAAKQSSQDLHSIQSIGVNLFTRPAIETAEEIGAGFQYQPPPGRAVPQNSGKTQKISTTPSLSTVKKPSQGGSSSRTLEFTDHGRRQRTPPSNRYKEDVGQLEPSPPETVSETELVDITRASREVRDHDISNTQGPHDVSNPDNEGNTSSFPFPNESPDETNLSHSDGRKPRPSYSPLANTQLPKSISDTRRKALATFSPHSLSLRRKTSLSPFTASERHPAQMSKISIKRAHPDNKQRSAILKPPLNTDETVENAHADGVERTSKRHRSGGRQKMKDLTRPLPPESPEYERISMLRPCSQASNISRPRAPQKMHHQQPTPTREQNSHNLMKFAKSWNTNYLYNQRLLDRWEQKMVMLEEHIAAQDSAIEQYRQNIEFRDQTINDLSTKEEQLRVQNEKVQDEITTSSNARKKLEEKLRACRNRLNDAINEQQQLFLRCKENCEKATACIQAEGHCRKESIEKASAAIELVRADIKHKVATAVDVANGQVENLNKTIESLETQLIEREKELERERQHALDLNNQLAEFHKLNEQSIQSVAIQNQQLLEKMKLDREHAKNTEIVIQKQDEKIDAILKALEETRSKTADPETLVESLEGLHNTTVEKIVTGVKDSMVSYRDSILADQGTLNENLGEIHLLCEGICERVEKADNVAIWQARTHDADMNIHTHIQQIQELQDEIHQMYIRTNEALEEREGLKGQLTSLQDAATNERAANQKADSLTEEVGLLRGVLNDRDTTITKSREDLEAAREELRAHARILQDKEEHAQNEHEQHQKAIELIVQQHKQAIIQAVSKTTKELQGQCQATEKRLQEADAARAQLEHELAELRQEVEFSSKANIDEDISRIRGELVEVITSITGLTTGLQESEHEREALQGNLEKWSRHRVEIDQMRNLLGRLAKDQPNAIKMSNQLRELLEIQKKMTGTLEYHQAGLANSEVAVSSNQSQRKGETAIRSKHDFNLVSSLQSGVHVQDELQNPKRKVVVKSPANDDDPAFPMSVEEERSTRRHLLPPRGIMKIATRSNSKEQEVEGNTLVTDSQRPAAPQPSANRRIAKRGSKPILITHSLYNRPVAGSVSEVSTRHVDAIQASPTRYKGDDAIDHIALDLGDSDRIVEVDNIEEPSMKRQRTNGVHVAQNIKASHSMSAHFIAQKSDNLEPVEKMPSGPKTLSFRGGPIERKPSGLLTYGSQGLGVKRPHNQPSTASNTMNSTDSQSTISSSQTMKLSESQN
ncbi:hypothetical protein F4781DRAFT_444760 [Annulohypoxylon bovei var. microspora]|nr:hypothetical protein F4781DRAFT_444760 [Annulohypoxylon bovei var. microspora]